MSKYFEYSIIKYINSVKKVDKVLLDNILNDYSKCKKYNINDKVSEYLYYVENKDTYISPSFNDVKIDVSSSTLKPKFILFSAPGATGKSALAKHLSYEYNALYWDISKVKIGTSSFSGSILDAVGPKNYSNFINDLCNGQAMLAIDAFDEAEIVSGRNMLRSFIEDINDNLEEYSKANVFFFARTETAQYIASLCTNNKIPFKHYEIGFFAETQAKEFIKTKIGGDINSAVEETINKYYSTIEKNISKEEQNCFLGYAPVLEAIAEYIKDVPNTAKLISLLEEKNSFSNINIVKNIMSELLEREQKEKVVRAFKRKCEKEYPTFTKWDSLYSPTEQLARLIYYILFDDKNYNNYVLDFLPDEMISDYQEFLELFLPQHPFSRNSYKERDCEEAKIDFTGPAFRDYTLACIMLNEDDRTSGLANMYFEEHQSKYYFPSQVFFDCYKNIGDGVVYASHLRYLYDSYKAKATALERTYMDIFEKSDEEDNHYEGIANFGMMSSKEEIYNEKFSLIFDTNSILFEQISNANINLPNAIICMNGPNARISNSKIICKEFSMDLNDINIEACESSETIIIAKEGIKGEVTNVSVHGKDFLKISSPNINSYYKFLSYKYDFEDESKIDIIKFTHAVACIFREFRTHKKDTLAKDACRIDNVTVGSSKLKKCVLDFLKEKEIIYPSAHLYKIDTDKMQDLGISYLTLDRCDEEKIFKAYSEFEIWLRNNSRY